MTRLVVLGGHGKIARLLARSATERGDDVVSVIRDARQVADIESDGAVPVVASLEEASAVDLVGAMRGADVVVFAAGAGPSSGPARKATVDLGGSVLAQEAAAEAGVTRFVQISAMGVDEPVADDASEDWRAYVDAKREADQVLRASGLSRTILRPGALTDDPGRGTVHLADRTERASIPRADVAELILTVIDAPETVGRTWEAVSGGEPIAEAVRRLAAER